MHCFFPIFNMKAETYLRDNFLERVSARIANPLSMAPANAVGWDVSPVSAIFCGIEATTPYGTLGLLGKIAKLISYCGLAAMRKGA